MKRSSIYVALATAAIVSLSINMANAISPESVSQGRQLFERNWTAGNPTLGSDGLGPLFNAQSCVACHHLGGIGGAGDARFNAKTVGIERISITGGPVNNDMVASMVSAFHPGYVNPSGTIQNTLPLSHHGGSPTYQSARHELMARIDSEFGPEGGPTNASEVRRSFATPLIFNHRIGQYEMVVQARLFQLNTSPLFGLGLIDEIPGKLIVEQSKLQKQHPEISGRPSTMRNGRYGRFGWRGNVGSLLEFVDQACAAEVGLETKRKEQPRDPTNPEYRNSAVDIPDKQIIAMRDFIKALPLPTRAIPTSSEQRAMAARGEQLFASVGCAICHVPDMGPAKGIYSDILLHDMGYESMDLNHANPYIVRATPVSNYTASVKRRTTGQGMMPGYYGPSSEISVDSVTSSGGGGGAGGRASSRTRRGVSFAKSFSFVAPTRPQLLLEILPKGGETISNTSSERKAERSGRMVGDFTIQENVSIRRENYVRLHYEPTNFNQEWRTPPLWGVRDSAPYMHDGRAETLLEAISLHDGESAGTRDRFLQLPLIDRHAVIAFLNTLVVSPATPQARNLP